MKVLDGLPSLGLVPLRGCLRQALADLLGSSGALRHPRHRSCTPCAAASVLADALRAVSRPVRSRSRETRGGPPTNRRTCTIRRWCRAGRIAHLLPRRCCHRLGVQTRGGPPRAILADGPSALPSSCGVLSDTVGGPRREALTRSVATSRGYRLGSLLSERIGRPVLAWSRGVGTLRSHRLASRTDIPRSLVQLMADLGGCESVRSGSCCRARSRRWNRVPPVVVVCSLAVARALATRRKGLGLPPWGS